MGTNKPQLRLLVGTLEQTFHDNNKTTLRERMLALGGIALVFGLVLTAILAIAVRQ